MDGIVDNIVRVESILEMAGDLLHGDAPAFIILPQLPVWPVGEGEFEEDSCQEHLNCDEVVLIGCSILCFMNQSGPVQYREQKPYNSLQKIFIVKFYTSFLRMVTRA